MGGGSGKEMKKMIPKSCNFIQLTEDCELDPKLILDDLRRSIEVERVVKKFIECSMIHIINNSLDIEGRHIHISMKEIMVTINDICAEWFKENMK